MAIGAVHVVVLVAVACLLLASTVLVWWGAEPLRARSSATLVLWTGVGLTVWTAVSVIPLPIAWLEHLSPHAADIWARCLSPLDRPGPAFATLSLDPGASRVQILRGVTYLLAFVAASRIAVRREGVLFLERVLLGTALVLAVAAIVHPALGAEKVFGLYTPRRDTATRHIAPILNPNVLAEYLNIGLCIALGQLLAIRSVWPRSILSALVIALVATQVWVASRGGVGCAALAIGLAAWMSRSREPERKGVLRDFLVPGLLAVAGVGMTMVGASEEAMGEIATADVSKLDLAREAFHIVPDFALFGVGRGAFESVFPAFRTDAYYLVYTHPENILAQWVTEWGCIAALAAFACLGFALRPKTALARSPRASGAWAAIACVAVQNLVDFGSEYPAIVIALAACAGVVTGGTSGVDDARRAQVWARRPARLVLALAFSSLLAVCLVVPGFHHELFEDRAALHASALDPNVPRRQFDDLAASCMLRHPAEPYLPFAGALRAVRSGDGSPLPWIERTVERALIYAPAHLILARWLTPRSPSQARLEYRLTLEQAPELQAYALDALAPLVHSYEDALESVPSGSGGGQTIGFIARSVRPRLPATARRLDDLGLALEPNSVWAAETRAKEALADLLAGDEAPWCVGERRAACMTDALARATRLVELEPQRCLGHSIHARLLLEAGDSARALNDLSTAADVVSDRVQCLEQLADLAALAKSDEGVTRALYRITHAGCASNQECIQNLRFVASRESARGNARSALASLQRALIRAPDDDDLLADVADRASRLDLHAEALRSYQALAVRHPDDARWTAAVTAEKLALVTGSIPY